MASRQSAVTEQFYTALISGDRQTARQIMGDLFCQDPPAEKVVEHLLWPVLDAIQKDYRGDRLTNLAYHYATRMLRSITDQMQIRYEQKPRNGQTVLVTCGAEESEELAGQLAADLLEAGGYTVFFTGGGIANDEIVAQLNELQADRLVVFGAIPATVPQTRLLIDRLHDIGACEQTQVIVGGGVFNRAEGLAEEIGADLWALDPLELVEVMDDEPQRRMTPDQRTVGRRRKAPTPQRKAA
ncbi:MAG: B12-binding domain-containing protein [Planctomycetota bacterium]